MADITLKKNYEEELETTVATRTEELRRAYEHVESVNEDLARFTHAAYHDMQEPLRAVVIALDYIKTRLTPLCDSEVTDFINYAQKNSLHMRELLKDILAYMRCGRDNHAVTEFSVKELVEAVVDSMRPMTREAEAEVIVGELPDISARREEIWQLFQNLIGNALKFRKGKGVRIEIGCVKEGGSHKFAVRDDGIGIEEKYLEKIFDLFTSLYTRDRYEGSGIGLSICRKIVELHGGRIWAESQPGKGSVFYFTLPAGPKT